jgi:hypothetical protein
MKNQESLFVGACEGQVRFEGMEPPNRITNELVIDRNIYISRPFELDADAKITIEVVDTPCSP